jgi:hypothetical protein
MDLKWQEFKAGQKLSEKDILGGLMNVLGEGISGGFKLGAAYLGGPAGAAAASAVS